MISIFKKFSLCDSKEKKEKREIKETKEKPNITIYNFLVELNNKK